MGIIADGTCYINPLLHALQSTLGRPASDWIVFSKVAILRNQKSNTSPLEASFG